MELSINIDHVATIRNARGGVEPEPVTAASICELAGATGIVVHLREDRRHIRDRDVRLLRETIQGRLNLEMASTKDIIRIALEIGPDIVTFVPEKREELTTEGGLNVAGNIAYLSEVTRMMHGRGIEVSMFIEPSREQIDACCETGADIVELHTGTYANMKNHIHIMEELARIATAADYASKAGLKVAAGHGLNYINTPAICRIPHIQDLSIGHAVISRAVFSGLENAVREMLSLIRQSRP